MGLVFSMANSIPQITAPVRSEFHPIISFKILSWSSCRMQNGVSVRVPVWEIAIALQPALYT